MKVFQLCSRPGDSVRLPQLANNPPRQADETEQDDATGAAPPEFWQVREVTQPPALNPEAVFSKFLRFRPYAFSLNVRPRTPDPTRFSFKMYNCDAKLIRWTLRDNGFTEVKCGDQWTVLWGAGGMRSSVFQTLGKFQKVNHFPRTLEITRKDCLFKNLAKMQALHSSKNYNFFPKTYILPQESTELTRDMENDPSQLWILKPSSSSQGRGIFLTQDPASIPYGHSMVACKYIDNPLLIDGFKFDLRIYVAITSINPLRLYVYEEGLARFATVPYRRADITNRYMHLTNYSVNKHSPAFTASATGDSGSKWSLSALKKRLAADGIDFSSIWFKIKEIIVKTIISIESTVSAGMDMYVAHKENCFELLGFDILIDDMMVPWLLEVNLSPSLNCETEMDLKIKSQLIADLFNLVGIIGVREVGGRAKTKSESKRPWDSSTHAWSSEYVGEDAYSRQERAIIRTAEEELKRMNNFERLFPGESLLTYRTFFDQERPFNNLLQHYSIGLRRGATRQCAWSDVHSGLLAPLPRPKKQKKLKHPPSRNLPDTYVEQALLHLRRRLQQQSS